MNHSPSQKSDERWIIIPVFCFVRNLSKQILALFRFRQRSHQFGRRNLTAFQRSELALKLKPVIQEKARENMLPAQNNNAARAACQISDALVEKIRTDEELAKTAGVSRDSILSSENIDILFSKNGIKLKCSSRHFRVPKKGKYWLYPVPNGTPCRYQTLYFTVHKKSISQIWEIAFRSTLQTYKINILTFLTP